MAPKNPPPARVFDLVTERTVVDKENTKAAYAAWLATAIPKRDPKTKEKFAVLAGVDRNTLRNWERAPDFRTMVVAACRGSQLTNVGPVMDALAKGAMKGGAKHAEVWLRHGVPEAWNWAGEGPQEGARDAIDLLGVLTAGRLADALQGLARAAERAGVGQGQAIDADWSDVAHFDRSVSDVDAERAESQARPEESRTATPPRPYEPPPYPPDPEVTANLSGAPMPPRTECREVRVSRDELPGPNWGSVGVDLGEGVGKVEEAGEVEEEAVRNVETGGLRAAALRALGGGVKGV